MGELYHVRAKTKSGQRGSSLLGVLLKKRLNLVRKTPLRQLAQMPNGYVKTKEKLIRSSFGTSVAKDI